MKSIIIGMGNPLLRDDGVGIQVVRSLANKLGNQEDVEFLELYTGGIRLMEEMRGFDRAIVVDAMVSGVKPGTIHTFSPAQFVTTRHTISTHDTDFCTSLEMAELLGIPVPSEIRFWGVEASEVDTFGEQLTEHVAAAVPRLVSSILQDLA